MRFSFIKIIFLIFLFLCPLEGISNILIFDVSQKKVSVSSDFNDEHFTIYGFSDSPKKPCFKNYRAEPKSCFTKKKKVFGMWTWNKTGEFSYPSLFHYYTNIKIVRLIFMLKRIWLIISN